MESEHPCILVIAFHFPPASQSSGYLRPFRFAQYLKEDHGWEVEVLTVNSDLYEKTDEVHDAWISENLNVTRTRSFDTQKHLSLSGKYLEVLASPDRWISWYPFAVHAGKQIIRNKRPVLIWSTCPIATTHLVAMRLAKRFQIPWIADFRDPMTLDYYPSGRIRWKCTRWVEKKVIKNASRLCFTSERTRAEYCKRYPQLEKKTSVIQNGFDELPLKGSESALPISHTQDEIVLLHAGALFPDGRHPGKLFRALRELIDAGHPTASRLRINLRAPGHEKSYQEDIERNGLRNHVSLLPSAPYEEVRKEMSRASGLLLFQGPVYDFAIPAKLYEYLASYRPILGLVSETGDTAAQLKQLQIPYVADIDDISSVRKMLEYFLRDIDETPYVVPHEVVSKHSRRAQTESLNDLIQHVLQSPES